MDTGIILQGRRVRLEPVTAANLPAVRACGDDPALWEFTYRGNPFTNDRDTQAWFDDAVRPDVRTFAIVDVESGEVAGSTRYADISEQNRKLEIGWTFLGRRFWRTYVNTEAKLLLFTYAFETWRALRVQLKAEAVNERSRSAILRLGATYEGTLRKFRVRPVDGSVRDTAFYSVTDDDWPVVKERLLGLSDSRSIGAGR